MRKWSLWLWRLGKYSALARLTAMTDHALSLSGPSHSSCIWLISNETLTNYETAARCYLAVRVTGRGHIAFYPIQKLDRVHPGLCDRVTRCNLARDGRDLKVGNMNNGLGKQALNCAKRSKSAPYCDAVRLPAERHWQAVPPFTDPSFQVSRTRPAATQQAARRGRRRGRG